MVKRWVLLLVGCEMMQVVTIQLKLELSPDSVELLQRLEALPGSLDIKQALLLADDVRAIREALQTGVALSIESGRALF